MADETAAIWNKKYSAEDYVRGWIQFVVDTMQFSASLCARSMEKLQTIFWLPP